MKRTIKGTWTLLAVVWLLVLVLTYWNLAACIDIRASRVRKEIFLQDNRFWTRNSETVARTLEEDEAAHHHPASLPIGWLQARDRLRELALRHGLGNLRMEKPDIRSSERGETPFEVHLDGSLDSAYAWLGDLEDDMTYLSAIRFEAYSSGNPEKVQFRLVFNYRYRIAAPAPAPAHGTQP